MSLLLTTLRRDVILGAAHVEDLGARTSNFGIRTTSGVGAPVVEHLRVSDIPKSKVARDRAFRGDPLEDYILNPPDSQGTLKNVAFKTSWDITFQLSVYRFVRAGFALTVDSGSAVILYLPGSHLPPSRWRSVEVMMSKLTARLMSPQQSRRNDELEKKYLVALTDALGDKVDQYFSIDGLYTDPEYQGRGYGSALVNAVLDLADKAGRPTYVSAIEKNVPFYESFGFIVAQEVTIGDDPDSHSEPVVLTVMIRRYQSTESESWSDEKAALLV